MRLLFTSAVLGLSLSAAPALAWGEMGGGYVNQFVPTNHEIAVWAYPSTHNYCPAGLQPVRSGGGVSCGVPTHVEVYHAPVYHAPAARGGYVATGKGYGEGYFVQDGKDYMGN